MSSASAEPEVIEAEATVIEDELSPLANADRWLASKRAKVAGEVREFSAYHIDSAALYRQAKKERASLNASRKEIDQERISMTRSITDAVKQFKADADVVGEPLDELIAAYDVELRSWETQAIERRRAMLRETYEDAAPYIALPAEGMDAPLVPFERVVERFGQGQSGKKWLLFGTNDELARTQLIAAVEQIAKGEQTIDAMVAEEDREPVKATYFSTLDMDEAMRQAMELKAQRERLAKLEAERKAAEDARIAAEREEAERRAEEVRAARKKAEADYAAGVRTGVLDMPGMRGGTVTPEQMHDIDMVKNGVMMPEPQGVPMGQGATPMGHVPTAVPTAQQPAPDVRHELLANLAGKQHVTLVFEQPLSELVLDVSGEELELFRRILRFNNVKGVIRGLRR